MDIQWGSDQVYKVGGKMFAVMGDPVAQDGVSFKASDVAFEVLTEAGRAIPAPYLARAKWVKFVDLAALDEAEVVDWLKSAHGLVAAKLPKKLQGELGLA